MKSSILETQFSETKNVFKTDTRNLSLQEAITAISSEEYAARVGEIRRVNKQRGKDAANELKKRLPGLMFSGTFKRRDKESLIQHSGLMCLDFDDCGIDMKSTLAADPHAVLCFISPRGTGLKLVIRIEPANTPEEHGESFDAAQKYFLDASKGANAVPV